MFLLQSVLLSNVILWASSENLTRENNFTVRNTEDGLDKQDTSRPQYQPTYSSDGIRPILVQRYPYLVPDERVYQPYAYKVPHVPIKYPSWPAPSPWPPKYPVSKPEEEKEDLEKSFLKVMYPAMIIFAIGSIFIPIVIFYNYKSIYGLGGVGPVGCGCRKEDGKGQTARLGRSHLIVNLVNLMATIEKALAEVEQKFMNGSHEKPSGSTNPLR